MTKDVFGCEVPDFPKTPIFPKDQAECQQKADALAKLLGPKWKGEGCYPNSSTTGQPYFFKATCGPVSIRPLTPCLSDPFKYYDIWIEGFYELMDSNPLKKIEEDPKKLIGWITETREWAEKVASKLKEAEESIR